MRLVTGFLGVEFVPEMLEHDWPKTTQIHALSAPIDWRAAPIRSSRQLAQDVIAARDRDLRVDRRRSAAPPWIRTCLRPGREAPNLLGKEAAHPVS